MIHAEESWKNCRPFLNSHWHKHVCCWGWAQSPGSFEANNDIKTSLHSNMLLITAENLLQQWCEQRQHKHCGDMQNMVQTRARELQGGCR